MKASPRSSLIAAFLVSTGIIMTTNAAPAGQVISWMEINPVDGELQITGRAYTMEAANIDYSLQVQRSGRSGNTTTKQGGKADMQAGRVTVLSTTSINIQPQDQLAVLLTLTSSGQIISTSAIQVGPSGDK